MTRPAPVTENVEPAKPPEGSSTVPVPASVTGSRPYAITGVTNTLFDETNGSSVQRLWTCGERSGKATYSFAFLNCIL